MRIMCEQSTSMPLPAVRPAGPGHEFFGDTPESLRTRSHRPSTLAMHILVTSVSKSVLLRGRKNATIASHCRRLVLVLPWLLPSSRAMSVKSTIGVAQVKATNNKIHNLLEVAKCVGWAKRKHVRMLFLPENCGFMGAAPGETLENAEPPVGQEKRNCDALTDLLKTTYHQALEDKNSQDPDELCAFGAVSLLDGFRTLARLGQMWISVGGMHVLGAPPAGDKARFYNTHVILDDEGAVRAIYRKIHLFDVCIPGKVNLMESNSTAAGHEVVVCDSPVGRLGLSTCYDMRFPELYAALVQRGAQVLLMPSAFTVPTGQAHWHILLRARAIECQTYVIAAAQYGKHNAKRSSYGHSLVVDPWGAVVADAGGVDNNAAIKSSVVAAEIDLDMVDSVRERMPVQAHREAAKLN